MPCRDWGIWGGGGNHLACRRVAQHQSSKFLTIPACHDHRLKPMAKKSKPGKKHRLVKHTCELKLHKHSRLRARSHLHSPPISNLAPWLKVLGEEAATSGSSRGWYAYMPSRYKNSLRNPQPQTGLPHALNTLSWWRNNQAQGCVYGSRDTLPVRRGRCVRGRPRGGPGAELEHLAVLVPHHLLHLRPCSCPGPATRRRRCSAYSHPTGSGDCTERSGTKIWVSEQQSRMGSQVTRDRPTCISLSLILQRLTPQDTTTAHVLRHAASSHGMILWRDEVLCQSSNLKDEGMGWGKALFHTWLWAACWGGC